MDLTDKIDFGRKTGALRISWIDDFCFELKGIVDLKKGEETSYDIPISVRVLPRGSYTCSG